MASKPYNGHPSYNAWNVSLWIGNDEGLYKFARQCYRRARNNSKDAADLFMDEISGETPDGVRWTKTNVARAIAGLFH